MVAPPASGARAAVCAALGHRSQRAGCEAPRYGAFLRRANSHTPKTARAAWRRELQLRSVAAALRKQDDASGVLQALRRVELLVRARPDELEVHAAELARALLHCRVPEWAEPDEGTRCARCEGSLHELARTPPRNGEHAGAPWRCHCAVVPLPVRPLHYPPLLRPSRASHCVAVDLRTRRRRARCVPFSQSVCVPPWFQHCSSGRRGPRGRAALRTADCIAPLRLPARPPAGPRSCPRCCGGWR